MTAIIIPENPLHSDRARPFADLIDSDVQLFYVQRRFKEILAKSYDEDERKYGKEFRRRMMTDTELKRRANIMARWFRLLRGELNHGLVSTMDHCAKALRTELNGGHYTPPDKRRLWAPE